MSPPPEGPIASWDFESCIELLRGGITSNGAGSLSTPGNVPPRNTSTTGQDVDDTRKTPSLGDFDAIFKHLGATPIDIPRKENHSSSSDETSVEVGSYSTAASSPPDAAPQGLDAHMRPKGSQWEDDIQNYKRKSGFNNTRRHALHKHSPPKKSKQTSSLMESIIQAQSPYSAVRATDSIIQFSSFDSEAYHLPIISKQKNKNPYSNVDTPSTMAYIHQSAKYLTPAWVTPPTVHKPSVVHPIHSLPPDTPRILLDPTIIRPLLYATRESKRLRIAEKLLSKFGTTSSTLEKDLIRAINQVGGNDHPDGVHIFVDSSNIAIGFAEALKRARGMNKNEFTKFPPLAYNSLALIMERGRGVARRILVGSSRDNVRLDYMLEAAKCGYEVSALERVEKFKEAKESDIERYRRLGANGRNTSSGSGNETPLNAFKTVTEQGVDEILHMKMLESIVDAEKPSTMVLATGDAAAAEYSSGFLRNVERALERGWEIELVAWRHSMSYAYRDREFTRKWKGKFTVVELDDFQEELLGIYTTGPYTSGPLSFL